MGRARDLARYSATRLALAPLMLWLIASLVFLLLRVAPGDPVDAVLGSRAPAAAKAAMRARLGLDQSLLDQYLSYLNGLIHGDLGQALINQEPVRSIIGKTLARQPGAERHRSGGCRFGRAEHWLQRHRPTRRKHRSGRSPLRTGHLCTAALLGRHARAVGVCRQPGVAAGGWTIPPQPSSPRGKRIFPAGQRAPEQLGSFPWHRASLDLARGNLALLLSGTFTTALRLNLRRTLRSDYVEASRSRGLSERQVILRHGLPNALLPVLTIAGITVASLIGGALLIEVTFSWPGIALRLQEAINQRDYPVVQGIVVVIAALVVLVSVAVDLLVAALDPRVRY